MTAIDRTLDLLTLTSPGGDVFKAKYRGSERSRRKKLGVFSYPNVDGDEFQDLGSSSPEYPLTFYFTGVDHDLEQQRFFDATIQAGPWQVQHPVHGILKLQLVSITTNNQPVDDAMRTVITCEWIIPIDPETGELPAEIANKIRAKIGEIMEFRTL